jgi:hypothetical protein
LLEVAHCPECNVPEPFSQGQVWLNNGDIVQKSNPQTRMSFIECENLDPLFKNIGDIIGISIEHIIVNTAARGTAIYMEDMITQEIKYYVVAKQVDPITVAAPILTYCHILGLGSYELMGHRYERDEADYATIRIAKPFSVPLAAGAIAGALSSLVGGEHQVTYAEIYPRYFEFTTHWTEYPKELKERVRFQPYDHREGDIQLLRCATCGAPKALGGYRWHLDDGLIINERSGRRMAALGPQLLDYLFMALEEELGETFTEVVVEAQRRFAKTGFYSVAEVKDGEAFRAQLALTGLGNLREIKMSPSGLSMRIDNVAGYLLTLGMVQGLFEIAYDVNSNLEWAISSEGDLEAEIIPRA